MFETIFTFIEENPRLVVGNFFGLVAIVFAFFSIQAATPKRFLFYNSCVIVSVITSYAFLGAWTGMLLNAVCLFRNITFAIERVRFFSTRLWAYILALATAGVGLLSWQGPISLLVIFALIANTIFISLKNNRALRYSLLVTCVMVIIYDFYFQAYLALAMEAISVVSAVIGLIRYRNQKEQ